MSNTSPSRGTRSENLTSEGPILLSTTEVRGDNVMAELGAKLRNEVAKGNIANRSTTQVLIISGSHGNPDMGDSGLTSLDKLRDSKDLENGGQEGGVTLGFYERDCMSVGVKPDKPRPIIANLPIPEDQIPDITEPMKTMNLKRFRNSYLNDDKLCHMTFKVIHVGHYHKHEEKLVADIKKLNPKVLAITWCFSLNGDMAMALRKEGVFAQMVMEHDLKVITSNPEAKLDDDQNSLIKNIVDFDRKPGPRNLFLWGYSGTGKTLFITEALKIKMNKLRLLRKKGMEFNIIVTHFKPGIHDREQDCSLMKDLKEKYLKNLVDESFIRFINFKQLCRELIGEACASESENIMNTKIYGNSL